MNGVNKPVKEINALIVFLKEEQLNTSNFFHVTLAKVCHHFNGPNAVKI